MLLINFDGAVLPLGTDAMHDGANDLIGEAGRLKESVSLFDQGAGIGQAAEAEGLDQGISEGFGGAFGRNEAIIRELAEVLNVEPLADGEVHRVAERDEAMSADGLGGFDEAAVNPTLDSRGTDTECLGDLIGFEKRFGCHDDRFGG